MSYELSHVKAKVSSTLIDSVSPSLTLGRQLKPSRCSTLNKFSNSSRRPLAFRPPLIQAKPIIGLPNDIYEQEADRVADQVMSMPEPRVQRACSEGEVVEAMQTAPLARQITPLVQMQAETEEEEPVQAKLQVGQTQIQRQEEMPEEGETEGVDGEKDNNEHVHRQDEESNDKDAIKGRHSTEWIPRIGPQLESEIRSLEGSGDPLQKPAHRFFETRLGFDLGQVRIHADDAAAEMAKRLKSKAFTHGLDIVLGRGQYNPETSSGKTLLAHELAHVTQMMPKYRYATILNNTHDNKAIMMQKDRILRIPSSIQGVQVNITGEKDGTALISPYSHARGIHPTWNYRVPTYKIRVALQGGRDEELFRAIRFGIRRPSRDPAPLPVRWTCNTGLVKSHTFNPFWNKYYSPHSFSNSGRRGGWVLTGHILIHEGPASGNVAGTLGCIEITGSGEWNRFLGKIENLAGASCSRISKKKALIVNMEGATPPVAQFEP